MVLLKSAFVCIYCGSKLHIFGFWLYKQSNLKMAQRNYDGHFLTFLSDAVLNNKPFFWEYSVYEHK